MYKIIGADGKEYGPISAEQVRQWIQEGRVNAQTKVLPEGSPIWRTVGEIPELLALLSTPTPPPSAMAPAPISMPQVEAQSTTNPLAISGMILGILSLLFSCCCYGLPWNLAGIICSTIALSQIKANPNQLGRGTAIAGLILSILGIAIAVTLAILLAITGLMRNWQKNWNFS